MNNDKKKTFDQITYVFGAIFLLWIVSWLALVLFVDTETIEKAGHTVNALFSGMALAVLIAVVLLQRRELKILSASLKSVNELLSRQQDSSQGNSNDSDFERKYFHLLDSFQRNIRYMTITSDQHIFRGREALIALYNAIVEIYGIYEKETNDLSMKELINHSYLEVYRKNQSELGHYFQQLNYILLFLDKNTDSDKTFYTGLLRTQLSSPELLLIFYDCLSEHGNQRFKQLIVKYNLLRNLPEDLIDKEHYALFKKSTAT